MNILTEEKFITIVQSSLCDRESLYEHNAEYCNYYLAAGRRKESLEVATHQYAVMVGSSDVIIFPSVDIKKHAESLSDRAVAQYPDKDVWIKYVDEETADAACDKLTDLGWSRKVRSDREVVYDLDILDELSGSHFSTLRNIRNKLKKNTDMQFCPVTASNIHDAVKVVGQWNDSRLEKYGGRDRRVNEVSLLNGLVSSTTMEGMLMYVSGNPVALSVWGQSTHKDTAIIFITKGLNNVSLGGYKDASTYMYLTMFELLKTKSFRFVNDGAIGTEAGTMSHKMSFLPVKYYRTYDFFKECLR